MSQAVPPVHSRRPRPEMNQNNANEPITAARFGETEWEARDSQRQRELEEARARASQMEKTMKWWSDCTANWREKWSKVRNERNKARDEAKQLRTSLEAAIKESNSYKREKNELELQINQLKKEMEKVHLLMMKHAGQFNGNSEENERDGRDNSNCSPDISSDGLKNVNSEDGLVTNSKSQDHNEKRDTEIEEYVLQGAVPKHVIESLRNEDRRNSAEERRLIQQLSKDDFEEECLMQQISMLQLKLDESRKSVQTERDEKNNLYKTIEKLTSELEDIKEKYEEIRSAKQEAVRELLTLQEQHKAELRILTNSQIEEANARENLERKLCELRAELERLQAENAAEWGKRERIESDKLALERDNKKLRNEVRDLQDRADRRGRPIPSNNDAEMRSFQQEIMDKNKEIFELRHSHNKFKKMLAETNTELGHAVRRAEQYENEVKRLRARVEELKHELAGAEDEIDSLQAQMQHLQTRNSISPKHHSSSKPNYPLECKPNINDLRQLFDENSRADNKKSHRHSAIYTDAKHTSLDESIFDYKNGGGGGGGGGGGIYHQSQSIVMAAIPLSRHSDFERVKQKFDKPISSHSPSSSTRNGKKARNFSSFLKFSNKRGDSIPSSNCDISQTQNNKLPNNSKLTESIDSVDSTKAIAGDSLSNKKIDAYMHSSINIDGLKVSDDEECAVQRPMKATKRWHRSHEPKDILSGNEETSDD
ncbi:coiled-coil domain-containing protein 102A isoform X2 [Sitodiplosis mosellana]|uniref:coiled-coil domain-containing protein 102A isoform X2 n=1 Tax=Sitodiplosis mosellana TaxID=263140 RepID=UPI002443C69C|nr:coiled-coil domain-containing protein 102A isoform X2 [Sitodiplosis mosellana]